MIVNSATTSNRLAIVLLIKDKRFCAEAEAQLQRMGFSVHSVVDVRELYIRLLTVQADILVMDVVHPENLDAISDLSSLQKFLIIGLGPDSNPQLEIQALTNGADRYLSSPLSSEQLLLNINAMLRYLPSLLNLKQSSSHEEWQLNSQRMLLKTPDAKTVNLTFGEFVLLKQLLQTPGQPVACEILLSHLYPDSVRTRRRDIHMLIYRFRKKIQQVTDLTLPIQSSHANGYLFTEHASII